MLDDNQIISVQDADDFIEGLKFIKRAINKSWAACNYAMISGSIMVGTDKKRFHIVCLKNYTIVPFYIQYADMDLLIKEKRNNNHKEIIIRLCDGLLEIEWGEYRLNWGLLDLALLNMVNIFKVFEKIEIVVHSRMLPKHTLTRVDDKQILFELEKNTLKIYTSSMLETTVHTCAVGIGFSHEFYGNQITDAIKKFKQVSIGFCEITPPVYTMLLEIDNNKLALIQPITPRFCTKGEEV